MEIKDELQDETRKYNLILRVNEYEKYIIERNARRFCKGNVSRWIRYAAMRGHPPDKVPNDFFDSFKV